MLLDDPELGNCDASNDDQDHDRENDGDFGALFSAERLNDRRAALRIDLPGDDAFGWESQPSARPGRGVIKDGTPSWHKRRQTPISSFHNSGFSRMNLLIISIHS